MTVKITLIPTTLEQYKALRELDLSAFIDPQYILTEGTAGELAPPAANDTGEPPAPAKRGPGRPRKADSGPVEGQAASPTGATAPVAPTPAAAPAAAPPAVETAGEPAEAQRAAISAAMKSYMQKGDHQSLRDIVRKYSESGTLSGVADTALGNLLGDIETALLML